MNDHGEKANICLRPGVPADGAALLRLWDEAIAWLNARGQPGQWGTEPASSLPRNRERVEQWTRSPGLTIAEPGAPSARGGDAHGPLGASVVTATCPEYVPPADRSELYLLFLIAARVPAARGVGSLLVRHAAAQARAANADLLRVDCWAGAPTLVSWYERQGFTRAGNFSVGDWRGQVFEMSLVDL